MSIIYLVNFLLAIATAFSMAITPILTTSVFGISLGLFALLESGSELLGYCTRYLSGYFYDKIKTKKYIFIFGAFLGLLSKISLFIPSIFFVTLAKISERIGNGAFAIPRNAYCADLDIENIEIFNKERNKRLNRLGLFKAFGCVIGAILPSIFVVFFGSLETIAKEMCIFLGILVFLSLLLCFYIKNPTRENHDFTKNNTLCLFSKKDFKNLYMVYLVFVLYFCGRYTDGFISLYLKDVGFPDWYYLATISIFNLSALLFCFSQEAIEKTANSFFKRFFLLQEKKIVFTCFISLFVFNCIYALLKTSNFITSTIGLVFWGVQRTSVEMAIGIAISNRTRKDIIGRSLGFCYLFVSFAGFLVSYIYGYFSKVYGFYYIFIISNLFSISGFILYNYLINTEKKFNERSQGYY